MISLSLVAIPVLTRNILVRFGGYPQLSWLTFFGLFGFSYQWGFVSFMLASVYLLAILPILIDYAKIPTVHRAIVIGVLVLISFFLHALVFAFVGMIAGLLILFNGKRMAVRLLAITPLLVGLPLALLWLHASSGHSSVSLPPDFDLNWFETNEAYYNNAEWIRIDGLGLGRLTGFFLRVFGLRDSLFSLILGELLVGWPFVLGANFSRDKLFLVPLFSVLIVLFFLLRFIFGTAYIFQRYVIFFVPFYVLAFARPTGDQGSSVALMMMPIAAVVFVVFALCAHLVERQDGVDFESVAEHVAPDSRVLSVVLSREGGYSIAPTYIHYPVWLMSRTKSDVSPNFSATHIQLVTYKAGTEPDESVNKRFEWRPKSILNGGVDGGRYDYLMVRSNHDARGLVDKSFAGKFSLQAESGSWSLFKSARGR